jgi:hypothetical protein
LIQGQNCWLIYFKTKGLKDKMLRTAFLFLVAGILVHCACQPLGADILERAAAKEAVISLEGTKVTYSGVINDENMERFLETVSGQEITMLVVSSSGGEVNAGMTLGEWVYERQVEVAVEGMCMSSCANYVFTAGRGRTIGPGSIVAWHGKVYLDIDNAADEIRAAIMESRSLMPEDEISSDFELLVQEGIQRTMEYFERSQERQTRFFDMIGVDEYLCSVGNEEYGAENFFVLGVKDMAFFGLHHVQAPDDYDSVDLTPFRRTGKKVDFIRLDR